MKVLIIEDEKLLQEELIYQLKRFDEFEVVHCTDSVESSVSWLAENANSIDLIFMDIELADGVCFEIFETIEIDIPIIFLTAYSEYALKAFKVNSIDYLLKPIDPNELEFALEKYKKIEQEKKSFDISILREFYPETKQTEINRLLVQVGDTYRYLEILDIAYFVAEDKYAFAITFENKRHLIEETLNKLEEILPEDKFYRVTRKFIVNINSVAKAGKYFNSRLKLYIKPSPPSDIIISRAKVQEFLRWMGR